MIEIELRDFRGCERASIRVDPIALIAGRNASGKSSIAQALGAGLSGQTRVIAGATGKSNAGLLVKTGAETATVIISGPGGKVRAEWPSCQVTSDGKPPQATEIAAGTDSVASMAPADRSRVIGRSLRAEPTREDLQAAFADLGLTAEDLVTKVWDQVCNQGWDEAHQVRKDRGAEYKGQWRQVTGLNYGSRIAASWVPKGWTAADETVRENDLLGDLAKLKGDLERVIAEAAVSDAERERLKGEADRLDDRKTALDAALQAATAADKALERATAARAALPAAADEGGLPCPHCGAFVAIRRISLVETVLAKIEPIPQAEAKRRRRAIAEADGDKSRLHGECLRTRGAVETARRDFEASTAAKTQLAALPQSVKSPAGQLEETQAAVEAAEARLKGWRQKRDADRLRGEISANEKILDVLAGDGLRAKKLARVLDVFNSATLKPLTDIAGWKLVAVEPDMSLTYGGRHYPLLSTSEQYRVRVVLQVAMAADSDLVVIDAADVLDAPTRSGLFGILAAACRAVVCMTLARREQVPDISRQGLGASYWLDNGILEPLKAPIEAAA
jgi:hypothetical protein